MSEGLLAVEAQGGPRQGARLEWLLDRGRELNALLVLAALMTLSVPGSLPAAESHPTAFSVRRGTNISHWLSQSKRRGEERRQWFGSDDVKRLAALGFDHLRIPVDEEQLWDEQGRPDAESFALLDGALDACRQNGLRAIVDLHIVRSHHFNEKVRPLWTEPAAQERFLACWRDLSSRLRTRSVSDVAYEPMNEPVADDPELWNRLVGRVIKQVREAEPTRVIVVGSNRWQSVDTFADLRVPSGDPNILPSFHFYTPMALTHRGASWTKVGEYKGPVRYPGRTVDEENLAGLAPDLARALRGDTRPFDKDEMERRLAGPLALAKKSGLRLYCGEWGCLPSVPRSDRLRWYADLRAVLEGHDIGWATWDYKGGFGIVDKDGLEDRGLIDTLLK
ncbi:MAG TPA: cellulase family glycosylhydrolase [Vicinamibacteria bacterium]|nr:cellulase family glycosylhydrolase [Vicinamibacteria bacterium]